MTLKLMRVSTTLSMAVPAVGDQRVSTTLSMSMTRTHLNGMTVFELEIHLQARRGRAWARETTQITLRNQSKRKASSPT